MSRPSVNCSLAVLACLLTAGRLPAGPPSAPAPCGVHYVEKTVYVPQWVVEKRKVLVTRCKKETRQYKYTVYRCVPETKQVTQHYTVLVPEVRKQEQKCTVWVPVVEEVEQKYRVCVPEWKEVQHQYKVLVPVWKEKEIRYTVLVPHREKREGTRTVCKRVPVTEKRTIHRDMGHWERRWVEVPCVSYCGLLGLLGCGPACYTTTVCRNVWVPKIVQQQIDVTVCKPVIEKQKFQYDVIVCRPEERTEKVKVCSYETQLRTVTVKQCSYRLEERTRKVRVCRYQPQERTRTIQYTVCVPQKRTRTFNVTCYKTVAEQKTGTCTVLVPYQEEQEIEVKVCRMVPKKVRVPVGCCHCGWH